MSNLLPFVTTITDIVEIFSTRKTARRPNIRTQEVSECMMTINFSAFSRRKAIKSIETNSVDARVHFQYDFANETFLKYRYYRSSQCSLLIHFYHSFFNYTNSSRHVFGLIRIDLIFCSYCLYCIYAYSSY